jgi:glycosyltransferase involved in cell wall biosynthesis
MNVEHKFLLDFAASYSGGGYKRLYEYAKCFNSDGGAWFAIHPNCASLSTEFRSNRFFVVRQSRLKRLYDDCSYIDALTPAIGVPALYYSYGIPLYRRLGRVNWFHLSNVLPLAAAGVPLSTANRLKAAYLGWKIKAGFERADVISAESNSSLAMIDPRFAEKFSVSVNGSDDEISHLRAKAAADKDNVATVVGTVSYKSLDDSYRVFEMLRATNPDLKLMVIGNPTWVPRDLRAKEGVVMRGTLKQSDVIDVLRRSKYYISTTRIENSYNAASEGIFFADESYISDIGPHRELLLNEAFDCVSIPGISRKMLRVRQDGLSGANLKSWKTVVVEMIARYREAAASK